MPYVGARFRCGHCSRSFLDRLDHPESHGHPETRDHHVSQAPGLVAGCEASVPSALVLGPAAPRLGLY